MTVKDILPKNCEGRTIVDCTFSGGHIESCTVAADGKSLVIICSRIGADRIAVTTRPGMGILIWYGTVDCTLTS